MASVNTEGMALGPDQLNDLDRWILDFLNQHEWATPNLLRAVHADEETERSRQWFSDRLTRLEEHGHIEKVHPDTAERRLVSDPRAPEEPDRDLTPGDASGQIDDHSREPPVSDDVGAIYDCPECEWTGDDWDAFQDHRETHEE